METHAQTACAGGVCRAMKPTEYSETIRNLVRTKQAVCVLISARRRDKKEKEDLPLLLYAYTNQQPVPYCDATRILGAYRLRKQRTAKRRGTTQAPVAPSLTTVCVGSASNKETEALLAKLDHKPHTRLRSFKPQVGDVKHNDAPLAQNVRELVKNGTIQKVKVKLDGKARKSPENADVRICNVCSFYLAYDRPKIDDVAQRATGCYYLYKRVDCPHTLAASSDPTKFNGTSTMSMNELGKYVVATASGEVDLAKWIYAKFHGTAYTADGKCLTDRDGPQGPQGREAREGREGREAREGLEGRETREGREAREEIVMGNTHAVRLAGREAPRHVPLSSLRLVTGARK